jgi:hypothetical protein
MVNSKDKSGVLEYLIGETLKGFDKLKQLKDEDKGHTIDYDFEIARDRKAAIILKGILAETHIENMNNKRQELARKQLK